MTRSFLAAAAVVAIALGAASGAAARTRQAAGAIRPATVAYSVPQQCEVLPVAREPFVKARALLAQLGCRVRRTERTSGLAKGLVVAAVGGERTYAFGHVVTLIVSSGPT